MGERNRRIGGVDWWLRLYTLGIWAIALGVLAILCAAAYIRFELWLHQVSVIALIALVVSVVSLGLTRRHFRLTARPILDFDLAGEEERPDVLELYNHGTGPALITSVLVAMGQEPLRQETDAIWDRIRESKSFGDINCRGFVDETALGAGKNFRMIADLDPGLRLLQRGIEPEGLQIRMKVEYRSVYRETFETSEITLAKPLTSSTSKST